MGTTIQATRTQTDVAIGTTVDRDGGITGLTVAIRIYLASDITQFLDFSDGAFKAAAHVSPTLDLDELGLGAYAVDGGFDLSAITIPAGESSLIVQYDITAGGETGNDVDVIQLGPLGESVALLRHQGAIWLDTGNGTPGDTVGEQGIPEVPTDNLADALSLLSQTGLRTLKVRKTSGGPLTLTGALDDHNVIAVGGEVNIALNGQDVDGTLFVGCELSGALGAGSRISAAGCLLDGVTNLDGVLSSCRFNGTIGVADGAVIFVERGSSRVPGPGATPIFDLGAAHATAIALHFRAYTGGVEIQNHDNAGDASSVDMVAGRVVLGATVTAGSIAARGVTIVDDSAIGGATLDKSGAVEGGRLHAFAEQSNLMLDGGPNASDPTVPDYDAAGLMLEGRMRAFDTPANRAAATPGNVAVETGELYRQIIRATSSQPGQADSYTSDRVL